LIKYKHVVLNLVLIIPKCLQIHENQNYISQTQPFFKKNSPVTALKWPRGFQEVKVPRFHDNGTGWW